MMRLFTKSLEFIKNNPAMIYSLVLLIFVPVALYFNTYYALSGAQNGINIITQEKAVLAENIANLAAQNTLADPAKLETLIRQVMAQNAEVQEMEFLIPNPDGNGFKIIASSEASHIGQTTTEVQNILAWNQQQGIGFIGTDPSHSQRFWKITKIITNAQGQKAGLIAMAISLKNSDAMMTATFNRSYLLLLLTILLVFLLVLNNARLFGYAVTVARLKEIDEMKDNFVSMASHELRAPLVAIKGNLEFFNDKNKGKLDPESADYLSKIDWSIDRLNSLVNDILVVSRLEGGRVPFDMAPVEPGPVIAKLVAESQAQAAGKGLELAYAPGNEGPVRTDRERFAEILVNLLSNALKYTEKGKVEVQTETRNKELLVTVADTGVGIAAEDLTKLFEKFYRIKNDRTKNIAGTGLGLWIAREMARKMGGDITVESIEGVGSHFTLHLPLA